MKRRQILIGIATSAVWACSLGAPEERGVGEELAPEPSVTTDIVYGHKFGLAMTFDVYRPQPSNGAGVILVNSAGWTSPGDYYLSYDTEILRMLTEDEMDELGIWRELSPRLLVSNGFTVFDVRHGSTPRFEMAEIVADLRRAVRYIRHHAGEYGVDSERLGLWGGSAGGHLALLLATSAEVGNEDASEDFERSPGSVAAVVAYNPLTDLLRSVTEEVRLREERPVLDLEADEYQDYSPINFVSADDPPALIIHGDQDLTVPIVQSESMYQALLASGVATRLIVIEGAGHRFADDHADRALAETLGWFEEQLRAR